MSNETLFYICGIALAVSAVLVSLAGLRLKDFPGRLGPVVALWFVVLVGSATTFAVLHAQDEQEAKAAEFSQASEEDESAERGAPAAQPEAESEGAPKPPPGAKGQGETTLQLAASPTKIAFDTTELSAKPGKVTIDFDNPAALEHDVAIEQNGKLIAKSALIVKGKTSVSADLAPGAYIFLCTVPGHAEAGMQGTLTVK
jgi:plastocyanin